MFAVFLVLSDVCLSVVALFFSCSCFDVAHLGCLVFLLHVGCGFFSAMFIVIVPGF